MVAIDSSFTVQASTPVYGLDGGTFLERSLSHLSPHFVSFLFFKQSSALFAVDRRVALAQIGSVVAGVAAVPTIASADGAVSAATITKARIVYGDRIANLKSAVDKGDFGTILENKDAFILFNSGVYPGAKNKDKRDAAIAATNAIVTAAAAGDKAALQKAYSEYVASNPVSALPSADKNAQSYSSDFGYLAKTKAA